MAETIKVVQGDELPQIVLTLTDDTANSVLDLSLSTTSVLVKFRKKVQQLLYLQLLLQNLQMVQTVKLHLILQVMCLMLIPVNMKAKL